MNLIQQTNKNEITITITRQKDANGKHTFTVDWFDEDFHTGPSWRGQVFLSSLEEAKRYWNSRLNGRTLIILGKE
jgi:hypothetical protein